MKRKPFQKVLAFLLTFVMVLSVLSGVPPVNAAAASGETHYLAFASDRHSNTSAIQSAMSSFNSNTEYVGLIGDMVDNTDSYNSSTVQKEVTKLFSNATVNIVWGTHDKNVNDDAGIVVGSTAGSSGLLYTGTNSDGSVAYYVYGLAYYDVESYSNAKSAATKFKSWVDSISDKSIPIFVGGHMPLHSQRKDNKGGAEWARAFNYAATGSETGTTITRDVVYLHGHNHTTESNQEWYYDCGTNVTMQDSNGGTDITIRFTYLTAGYLNANEHATQITLTDDTISFVRSGSNLGSVSRVKTHTHSLVKTDAVEATCTTAGNNAYYTCSDCGKVFSDSAGTNETTVAAMTIAAKGHTVVTDAAVAATCTTDGKTEGKHCSVCGTVLTAQETVKATGHTLTKTAAKAATCTTAGNNVYYTCSGCGKIFSDAEGTNETTVADQTIAATGHTLTAVAAKDATCTTAGNKAYYTCSKCDKVFSDKEGKNETTVEAMTIAATGHTVVTDAAVAATCTTDGKTEGKHCSVCGTVLTAQETVKATGHTLTKTAAKAATCTTAGNNAYYTCSVCGKIFSDAAGTNETTVAKQTIEATGHTLTAVAAKDATCTTAGNKAYYTCSACGKVFSDAKGTNETTVEAMTIAAKGHSMKETEAVAATCTTAGNNAYYTCSVCGLVSVDAEGTISTTADAQIIEAKGHKLTETSAKDATCTAAGNKTYYTCSTCGKIFSDAAGTNETTVAKQTIEATGHDLTAVSAKDATCTTAGNKAYYTCSKCDKVFSDKEGKNETTVEAMTIAATGHTVVTDAAVAATCTTAGKTEGSHCSVCGTVIKAQETIAATGHTLTKTSAKAATCTAAGNNAYYTCSVCDKVFSDAKGTEETTVAEQTIEATGHTLTAVSAKDATCTTAGNNAYYTCSVCDKVFSDKEGKNETTVEAMTIAATGHTVVTDAAVAATCTTDGKTEGSHCSVCGTVIKAQETIAAKGHTLTKTDAKAATCTAAGNNAYYTCSVCDKVFSDAKGTEETTVAEQTIEAIGHTLTAVAAKDATCTAAGNKAYYTCSKCDKVFSDAEGTNETTVEAMTIAAKGHSMKETEAVAATCTTAGNNAYYTCSVCGLVSVDAEGTISTTADAQIIAAKGHKLTETSAKDATCTAAGNKTYYTCSTCGKIFSDAAGTNETTVAKQTIEATGHTLTAVAAKAATCTTAGNKAYYTCSKCDKVFSDKEGKNETTVEAMTIAATGHTVVTDAAVAATCTTDGKTEGSHCSVCGTVIKAQETIAAKGHTLTKTDAKNATCTTAGNNAYYTCSVCDKVFSDAKGTEETTVAEQTIEATGHTLTAVAAKDATCTTAGNKAYYTCSKCDKVFSDKEGKNETTVEAMTIAATGHTVVTDAAVAATCTTAGKTEGSHCSVCGTVIKAQETIAAKGHTLTKTAAKAATCTAAGNNAYYTCSVCDKVFSDAKGTEETTVAEQTIEATGHTLTAVSAKDATCTTAGNNAYYTCSVCDKVFSDKEGKNETTVAAMTIAATGHKMEKTEAVAATCTTDGNNAYYTCSVCGSVFVDEEGTISTTADAQIIAAKGHTVETDAAVAATCTTDGKSEGSHCSVCGTVIKAQETINATGHDLSAVAAKDATCTENGNKAYYICSKCNKVFSDAEGTEETTVEAMTIAAKDHTVVTDAAVAATCTSAGKTEGKHCSVCGTVIEAQETIEATGHTLTKTAAKAATCTTDGNNAYYTCSVCGKIFSDAEGKNETTAAEQTIEATGHTVVTDAAVAATCTTAGKTEGKHCSVCGEIIEAQETVNATGHTLVKVDAKDATATTDGNYSYYICSSCGKVFSDAEGTKETTVAEQTIKATGETSTETSEIKVTKIVINGPSHHIAEGKRVQLSVTVSPSNATNKKVSWKSSNTRVATVDQNGRVTVNERSGGQFVTITATATDGSGVKGTYQIESMQGMMRRMSINGQKSLKVGKTTKLNLKIKATKYAYKSVAWTTSNKKYAIVSSKGVVKALNKGKGKTVKITATALDGSDVSVTQKIKIK